MSNEDQIRNRQLNKYLDNQDVSSVIIEQVREYIITNPDEMSAVAVSVYEKESFIGVLQQALMDDPQGAGVALQELVEQGMRHRIEILINNGWEYE